MATLYPFPPDCPSWLKAWCELNGYNCVEAQGSNGDQWYLFRLDIAGFTIDKSIDILLFLQLYGGG